MAESNYDEKKEERVYGNGDEVDSDGSSLNAFTALVAEGKN